MTVSTPARREIEFGFEVRGARIVLQARGLEARLNPFFARWPALWAEGGELALPGVYRLPYASGDRLAFLCLLGFLPWLPHGGGSQLHFRFAVSAAMKAALREAAALEPGNLLSDGECPVDERTLEVATKHGLAARSVRMLSLAGPALTLLMAGCPGARPPGLPTAARWELQLEGLPWTRVIWLPQGLEQGHEGLERADLVIDLQTRAVGAVALAEQGGPAPVMRLTSALESADPMEGLDLDGGALFDWLLRCRADGPLAADGGTARALLQAVQSRLERPAPQPGVVMQPGLTARRGAPQQPLIALSLGENCLPDRLLKRHQLKSFSTPFSHGRSNIDYARALWDADFDGLLDPAHLQRASQWGDEVVRNLRYRDCEPLFEMSVAQGFEFTHHDVLDDSEARASVLRKIDRFRGAPRQGDLLLLYHHRGNPRTDVERLVAKLDAFAHRLMAAPYRCRVFLMRQEAVSYPAHRGLLHRVRTPAVDEFVFRTREIWGGNDDRVFWAEVDDDLIAPMFAVARQWT